MDVKRYVLMIFIGFVFIEFVNNNKNFKRKLEHIYFKNNILEIDTYTFIHCLTTMLISLYYPYHLDYKAMLLIIVGWDLFENYMLPSLSSHFEYCRESPQNIFTDWLVSIPSIIIAYNRKN